MKLLQRACIVGAVAVLSPSMMSVPSTISQPTREPVRASKSLPVDSAQTSITPPKAAPLKLASLEQPHANATPIPPLGLEAASPVSMSSPETTVPSVETPSATLRASSATLSKQFLKALAAANPMASRVLPSTRLAYAALPDVTLNPMDASPPLDQEAPDFANLADYAYSEVLPAEKPADTVRNALRDIPEATPREEVRRAAHIFGLDVTFMEAVAKIESDFNPKGRTGSYIGLFQLSKYEFDRYGSGEITDARDNAIAGVYKFAVAAILFELLTHKKATLAYLYLIHQQGTQGAAEHVAHPERIAWESMCATDEGRVKGESWCKRAIWQNTLPEIKKLWGSVEKLTSAGFVEMWRDRVVTLYRRYSTGSSAAALQ